MLQCVKGRGRAERKNRLENRPEFRSEAPPGFRLGGIFYSVGLVGSPEEPPDTTEILKICYQFIKKIAKCIILGIFQKG